MKTIAEQIQKYKDKIKRAGDKITDLQNSCTHIGVRYKFRGDAGNYDPSDDFYWIEWTCPTCNKYWTSPQDHASYNKIQELDGVRVQ